MGRCLEREVCVVDGVFLPSDDFRRKANVSLKKKTSYDSGSLDRSELVIRSVSTQKTSVNLN